MKAWWLALMVVAGCATEDKPDIDATGTVNSMLTYGGGNCQKMGKESFQLFLAKNSYDSYDITTTTLGAHINGSVVCGSQYCRIEVYKDWFNNADNLLGVDATLTLDGTTNQITGSGKYTESMSSFGTSCEQQVTFAGTLQ